MVFLRKVAFTNAKGGVVKTMNCVGAALAGYRTRNSKRGRDGR
jgi:hypothetical protein